MVFVLSDTAVDFYLIFSRYDSDNEMFLLRVRDCVEKSKASVYDPPAINDSHALVFSTYQPAIHDRVLEEMKKEKVSCVVKKNSCNIYISTGERK